MTVTSRELRAFAVESARRRFMQLVYSAPRLAISIDSREPIEPGRSRIVTLRFPRHLYFYNIQLERPLHGWRVAGVPKEGDEFTAESAKHLRVRNCARTPLRFLAVAWMVEAEPDDCDR